MLARYSKAKQNENAQKQGYALEKFGRLPQNHIEMTSARGSKIIEETRRFMRDEEIKK